MTAHSVRLHETLPLKGSYGDGNDPIHINFTTKFVELTCKECLIKQVCSMRRSSPLLSPLLLALIGLIGCLFCRAENKSRRQSFKVCLGNFLTRVEALCFVKVTAMQPACSRRPIMSGGHESPALHRGDEERPGALVLRGCSCTCLRNACLP